MERRKFVKDMLTAGLWLTVPMGRLPWSPITEARADDYDGPLWVHLSAWGGWDTALMCDPKLNIRTTTGNNAAGIKSIGNLKCWGGTGWEFQEAFFQKHYLNTCVFNGVDTGTNNHAVGERYCSTGRQPDGSPSFVATIAAARAAGRPMSYLAMSGYSDTSQLISPTIVSSANKVSAAMNSNPSNGRINPSVLGLIRQASNARLSQLISDNRLVSPKNALERLLSARQGQAAAGPLTLPADGADVEFNQINIGLSAYAQGLACAMTIQTGGFDSHSDNDSTQLAELKRLYVLADKIITDANTKSLPVIVVMTSDFGRTPSYTGSGTDHWPVTSMITICSNQVSPAYRIAGNRVIGATNAQLQAQRVNVNNPIQLDPANGEILTPAHVMKFLRNKAQIESSPVLALHPLTITREINLS